MSAAPSELDQAWALLGQQRFADSARLAGAILQREPNNVAALACHAMANWKADGDIGLSLTQMRRAVALAPAVASIRHNLATLLASHGEVDAAAAEFRAALRIKPDDTLAFYGLTQNTKFREETDLLRAMQSLHANPGLDRGAREFLDYGLAKAFDDLGAADKAMTFAMEANTLGARPYDMAGEGRAVDELRELAGLDAFRRARDSGHPSRAMLFIVGMPRSGTTLVEAMLARHPDVLALGESMQIPEIEAAAYNRLGPAGRDIGRHQLALDLSRDWIAAQAEGALKRATTRSKSPFKVVTDKLPENAMRLGLIARLFPKSRVIHVRRHPLDTGVSNFFQRFSSGQGYSNRLDWIGMRTRQIADSMEIWKRALSLPILDVSYELLVADPEPQARRIMDFAGLDWTPDALTPEQAERSVLTASQYQVRQPINQRSVDRWRRYEPWLGPMIEAMGGMGWIEAEVAAGQASVASRSNSNA